MTVNTTHALVQSAAIASETRWRSRRSTTQPCNNMLIEIGRMERHTHDDTNYVQASMVCLKSTRPRRSLVVSVHMRNTALYDESKHKLSPAPASPTINWRCVEEQT